MRDDVIRRATPLIEADRLTRRFPGRHGLLRRGAPVQAVTDVSFRLDPGETVGLVGESGSGKSTIGRMVLGLLPPSDGEMRFEGNPLAAMDEGTLRRLRRRMQLVFQDPQSSLDPRRTVGAQIADGLEIFGICPASERPARVAALLEQVGLGRDAADRYPGAFSGGQRQRIALARALATDPDVLVADEPVSALDVSVQAQVLALMARLRAERGLAMLFISHDLAVVRHLCDRVIVLYLGRIMEEGPAETIFSAPAHPYTQALLAATPVLGAPIPERLLDGDPPSPSDPPPGCPFHTRCPRMTEACTHGPVPVTEPAPGQRVACHHPTVPQINQNRPQDPAHPQQQETQP